ncbi:aspartate/glutamate racemase family protein [Sphingomonas crocodyli]|uniref:Hydrogenase expression protein HupH n=1 Tax=Sphingomonas crocodyli TaxID=1979270 RepID=A0A437M5K5_9SPHN|nr:aspartate/glutamate racemase family protein [Sphingomonas crocodyli]RVT92978.1 hydrogenase expression protein HupH [Sphingomonas crocodyli]
MAHHIRLLTVHTTDMSHKLLPLKRIFCSIKPESVIAGVRVTEDNIDALIAAGDLTADTIDDVLDLDRVRLSQTRLRYGASSIESEFDDLLSTPYIIGAAMEAEDEGCSAVIIDCVGDPALHAAREAVRIPVIGAGEAALHIAATLGHRFSIVTIADRLRPILDHHMTTYGVAGQCCSIRAIEISGVHSGHDAHVIYDMLARECLAAVEQDAADLIVLGCTAFFGASEYITQFLEQHGQSGIPIIDPLPSAIGMARSLLDVGLTHSLATYPPPPIKARSGYLMPTRYHQH